ncbi:MAG: S49 family peptidase [Chloroflexota bacterium]
MNDMQKMNQSPDFFTDLKRELREVRTALSTYWSTGSVSLRNGLRTMRGVSLDYVLMPLGGPLPERSEPPRSFLERQLPLPPPPLSMEVLNRRLQAIADADNVKGVVLLFQGFGAGLGTLQNVRRSILRLREAGKEVVVYTPYLDMAHYYVASAADRIVTPPGTMFEVLGLRLEAMFLKDALAQVGMQMDVVQISPYKTALNMFGESDMTPEQQEQMSWLLDDRFDEMTAAMANGRSLSQSAFQDLINRAPLFAEEMLAANLVDAVAYEDELAYLLAPVKPEETALPEAEETPETAVANPEPEADKKRPQAKLVAWSEAANMLLEKPRRRQKKFIGVVSLEGGIIMGPSRNPPIDLPIPFIGGDMAGEQTLRHLLREAEKMDALAALIFHVDSGGGSALASDLIGREIERISRKKPVLVYMGNVAASGGYYVSAYGGHIMCQTGTITGSIGVISGRLSTQGLRQKLHVTQVSLQRGDNAGLYTESGPMNDGEREIFWNSIVKTYEQFKQVVANGRSLPYDELDPLCEGRVWTGRQAADLKLVDSHGDFVDAVRKAAEMGGLETGPDYVIPVMNLFEKNGRYLLPRPFEAADPTDEPLKNLADLGRMLLGDNIAVYNGQPLFLMPFEIRF